MDENFLHICAQGFFRVGYTAMKLRNVNIEKWNVLSLFLQNYKTFFWKGEQETKAIPGCNAQTGDWINNVSKINLNKGFTAIITL